MAKDYYSEYVKNCKSKEKRELCFLKKLAKDKLQVFQEEDTGVQ